MVVNLGDQYTRAKTYGRYRVLPIRERVLAQLLDLGLEAEGTLIWRKISTMNSTGGGAVMGSYPFPRNGNLKLDYEFLLVCRKPGPRPPVPTDTEVRAWFDGHWVFPGERMAGHHAMFPKELPRRCLRMYTTEGDRVLDPFSGSGTTLAAAHELGRYGLGYEINADFQPLFEERVGAGVCRFIQRDDAHHTRTSAEPDFFGSAVALGQVGRRRYTDEVRVEEVLGALRVRLSDGRALQLEGLSEPTSPEPCAQRLRELTLNKPVVVEPTSEGKGYLRLRNRTLINSRLLREGLAPVDPDAQHRNRKRFLRYASES